MLNLLNDYTQISYFSTDVTSADVLILVFHSVVVKYDVQSPLYSGHMSPSSVSQWSGFLG